MTLTDKLTALAHGEACVITDSIDITNGTLYLFACGNIEAACIVYNDGNACVMQDWQSPSRPQCEAEIANYQWVEIN